MNKKETKFYLPFHFNHPKKANSISCNVIWLKNIGLVNNFEQAKLISSISSEYMRCCYPEIEPRLFHDFLDFASWNCIMDDIMESDSVFTNLEEKIEFLSAVKFICEQDLENAIEINEKQVLINSLINVKGRIRKHIPHKNYSYIMNAVSDFLSGIIWEISTNYNNRMVGLNLYCMIKTKSVGVMMAYALSLALHGIIPDATIINKKEFIVMMNCILFVMAIDNDLYSFNKEKTGDGRVFNIIETIQHELNVDLYQATSYSISLRNRYLHKYLSLKDILSSHSNIKKYAECFERLITGNVYFGHTSRRYTKKSGVADGFDMDFFSSAAYHFKLSPDYIEDDIQDIIDLTPSISWWLRV